MTGFILLNDLLFIYVCGGGYCFACTDSWKTEEGVRSIGAGAMGSCELSMSIWLPGAKVRFCIEQDELLTTESSL